MHSDPELNKILILIVMGMMTADFNPMNPFFGFFGYLLVSTGMYLLWKAFKERGL